MTERAAIILETLKNMAGKSDAVIVEYLHPVEEMFKTAVSLPRK